MVDARLFQALSDSTRLDILALLARGTINVSRMVAHLGCAQPAVSRHLRVLREARLITHKRKGKEVEYSISPGVLAAAAAYLGDLVSAEAEGAVEPRQQEAQPVRPVRPARGLGPLRARRAKAPGGGRRGAAGSERTAPTGPGKRGAARSGAPEPTEPAAEPSGDFARREGEFVIEPRRKSGLDDFLL